MLREMRGEPTALLSTLQSLPDDERAVAERELAELSRAAALGALAADVAHDVANPLFGVLGLVELLLEDAEPGSDDAERLRLVNGAALEMKATLTALLEFARPAADEPERADLADAARSAVALVRHGVGKVLEIEERYPASAATVACPPSVVVQIVLLLLPDARTVTGLAVSLSDGALQVEPATGDELRLTVARRLAADHGGTVERSGETATLKLPHG
jgi:signal transduction histidine kinase